MKYLPPSASISSMTEADLQETVAAIQAHADMTEGAKLTASTKMAPPPDGFLERMRVTLRGSVRKNLVMTEELATKLDEVAARKGTNVSELMRRALDLYLTVDEAVVRDKMAVGLVKNPEKLDTRIVGL